jgi:hypothetical protein
MPKNELFTYRSSVKGVVKETHNALLAPLIGRAIADLEQNRACPLSIRCRNSPKGNNGLIHDQATLMDLWEEACVAPLEALLSVPRNSPLPSDPATQPACHSASAERLRISSQTASGDWELLFPDMDFELDAPE